MSNKNSTQNSTGNSNVKNIFEFPIAPKVFDGETTTPQQRFILLAARDAALRNETTQREIAEIADCSKSYITTALMKFSDRRDLPVIYNLYRQCIAEKKRKDDSLTEYQARIIDHVLLDPTKTNGEIADAVGCSSNYVWIVKNWFSDMIIDELGDDAAEALPTVAEDIAIDHVAHDRRQTPLNYDPTLEKRVYDSFRRHTLLETGSQTRLILLAAREWAAHGVTRPRRVAQTVGCPLQSVKRAIKSYRLDPDHPTAAAVSKTFYPDLTYDSLASLQRDVANEFILNPNDTHKQIADNVNTSTGKVSAMKRELNGIIKHERNNRFD